MNRYSVLYTSKATQPKEKALGMEILSEPAVYGQVISAETSEKVMKEFCNHPKVPKDAFIISIHRINEGGRLEY